MMQMKMNKQNILKYIESKDYQQQLAYEITEKNVLDWLLKQAVVQEA